MKKSNTDKMVEILRLLKPEMNGAVTGEMEKRGVRYGLNYGVAIPVIRRVARQYAPDHALAGYLFRQDVRELKLAAVYIGDPGRTTAEQMEAWADAMPADEIMEHAAMNLFHASPDADTIISIWTTADDRKRQKGALHMIGRRVLSGLAGSDQARGYLQLIENSLLEGGGLPVRATVYALCRIGESNRELHAETVKAAERLVLSPSDPIREAAEETLALLEYSTWN